jgi:hypothetical protein
MIKTYPQLEEIAPIVPFDKRRKKKLVPGLRVRHSFDRKSDGIIIAITNDQISVMWTVEPEPFRDFIAPLIRRVSPGLIANQIISVQPMTAPVGGVFYMDYTYGDTQKVQTASSGSV